MTEADVIAHWRRGARDEMESASLLCDGGKYAGALFHCHLAVEKTLKAEFMEGHRKEAPLTHDLLQLAMQLTHPWTEQEKKILADLTEYAIIARYDDPLWAEQEATKKNVTDWIAKVDKLISPFLS